MSSKPKNISIPKTKKQYDKIIVSGDKNYKKGNYSEALLYYTKALDYKGYNPNILVLMARCLFNLGMKNKAINLMEHALHQNADNPSICESLGSACLSFDLNELAIKFFSIYIQLNPSEPIGYNNLATALREDGQFDESIQLLQEIIPIFPENAYLWNSAGAGVSFRDGYAAAQPFYEEAYRLNPNIPIIASNLCLAYSNLQQYEKAYDFAKKAVALVPASPAFNLALFHSSFNVGKFDDAFKALAWHNYPSEPGSVFMPYNIKKWQGQDLAGKTILIGAEQGIGDEIFFASLYPDLIRYAKHVIIGCDKRLIPLFKNSFKEATILPYVHGEHKSGYKVRMYEDINPDEIDYMCLYTELMRYRWRSIDDIPDLSDGFLQPELKKIKHWKNKLSKLPHKINVGICWRSGLKQAKRSMFYADLMEWVPVLKTKNVNFINIQYGECDKEIKEIFDKHGIILHNFEDINLKDDFEDVSALIKNLDLVLGPAAAPVAQAAATGTLSWWITYNMKPWWSFGYSEGTPLFQKNKVYVMPHTSNWTDYMGTFAEQEFTPWVENKLKTQR
ncbi:MAG: tetratricopeptide repeat protein [Emcibacter sp.]|nr:tetratricopeptide repeat protein [Emcibacter sp.]